MIHLQGHSALITGGTQGVGRSIAEAYARSGANVCIHGRRDGEGDAAVAACRELGVQAEYFAAELTDSAEEVADTVLSQALELMPAIDILVNNAGAYLDKPFLEMDWETFDYTMRLNVAAPFFLTQRFARHWIEQKVDGRVLLVGSINGKLSEPVHVAYDTSKGAVDAMVRSLCVSLAPHGLRVNGMAPGLVRTPLTAVIDEDPNFANWMELHTPNGQVPRSDVCGDAAVFLVSDGAWHIQGQMLLVDGGMSAWQQPDMPPGWNGKQK